MFPNFYIDNREYKDDMLDCEAVDNFMFNRKFIFLGQGRHRRTYLSPNKRYVLKFARYKEYIGMNRFEHAVYKLYFNRPDDTNSGCYYAPCHLIDGHMLMMRAMTEIYGRTNGCDSARRILGGENAPYGEEAMKELDLPNWLEQCFHDSAQVGKLPNGKFVLYDYA